MISPAIDMQEVRSELLGDLCLVQWGNTSLTKQSYVGMGFTAFSATGPDGRLPDFAFDSEGIVLSAIGANCGRCFWAEGKWSAIKNTITITPVPTRDVHMRYLYHTLRRPGVWSRRGGGQPFIGLETARAVRLFLPTIREQERIAAILDRVDAIRRKRSESVALTNQFLKSSFAEMFGSTWLNGGGRKTQFGKVLLQPLRNGVSPSSKGQIPGKVLTLSAVTNSIFNPTAAKVALFAEALNPDKLVSCREFLVCRGNGNLALVGTAKFPTQDMPDTVFPDTVIAARPDPHVLDPRFLEFAWQSPFVREQLRVGARTTNGTYKINQAVLEELWVPLPAMERQQEFSALHQRAFGLTSRLADPGWDTLAHSLMQTFYPDFQSTGAA